MCQLEIPIGVLGTPEEVAETVLWMYVFLENFLVLWSML